MNCHSILRIWRNNISYHWFHNLQIICSFMSPVLSYNLPDNKLVRKKEGEETMMLPRYFLLKLICLSGLPVTSKPPLTCALDRAAHRSCSPLHWFAINPLIFNLVITATSPLHRFPEIPCVNARRAPNVREKPSQTGGKE